MEITIPTRLEKDSLIALPGMLIEPSTTIYLDEEHLEADQVKWAVSEACLEEGILSFRMDGEIIDVREVMATPL